MLVTFKIVLDFIYEYLKSRKHEKALIFPILFMIFYYLICQRRYVNKCMNEETSKINNNNKKRLNK